MDTKKRNDADVGRRDFLKKGAAAGVGAGALAGLGLTDVAAQGNAQRRWDLTADFVTIGAGVSGLAGAVSALEHGASVIMVEENFDIGGHGMVSGGNVHLGGGTSRQRKHGIQDSADQVFQDWVRYDHRESRYSDRDLVRAFADENAATFEFLVANGVQFHDESTGPGAASTVPRQGTTVQWPDPRANSYRRYPTGGDPVWSARSKKARRAKGATNPAAAQDDEHRPGEPHVGKGSWNHRNDRRPHRADRGEERRPDRHRRPFEQRELPQNVRPEADRGVPGGR